MGHSKETEGQSWDGCKAEVNVVVKALAGTFRDGFKNRRREQELRAFGRRGKWRGRAVEVKEDM